MTDTPPPEPQMPNLSAEDLVILVNALNYMAHGISDEECSTLTGYGRDKVADLRQRIAAAMQSREEPS